MTLHSFFNRTRSRLLKKHWLKLAVYYFVLFGIGFVFLYPILYMVINSFLSPADLTDPAVFWIPTEWYFGNFIKAFETLDFLKSFGWSVCMSAGPALLQTAAAAVTGFALARFRLPGQKLWIVLIIAAFMIPSQLITIPNYIFFDKLHMIGTIFPFYLKALFGQGLRSTVFILIFYQYFRIYPISFDEAASLDGAGSMKIFMRVALPMSTPAILISLLLSFVWYWNETSQANLLFGQNIRTLPLQLANYTAKYEALYGTGTDVVSVGNSLNEAITLAGTLLSILPVVILFICVQKYFMQSIEKTGLTGE